MKALLETLERERCVIAALVRTLAGKRTRAKKPAHVGGLCRYSTDVAKYTLLVSFTQIFDQVSRKKRPLRRAVLEGVHPTYVAHSLSAPHRRRTLHFSQSPTGQG